MAGAVPMLRAGLSVWLSVCLLLLRRYKAELQASLARQSSMERTHDKEHLEWQQRLETCQHQQHQRQEELVEALMKARDEVDNGSDYL